jgi:hypothetical protein
MLRGDGAAAKTTCQREKIFWGAREGRRGKNFGFGPFSFLSENSQTPMVGPDPLTFRPCVQPGHPSVAGPVVLLFRIRLSSERSEREIFFFEGETPNHLIGAAAPQPQQLSCLVAMSERSERKIFF